MAGLIPAAQNRNIRAMASLAVVIHPQCLPVPAWPRYLACLLARVIRPAPIWPALPGPLRLAGVTWPGVTWR